MTIPSFDGRGLLPPFLGADETTAYRSPYFATISDLVSSFGVSPDRLNLIFGLIKYRELLSSFGYVDGAQFIDGSFVENIEVTESRDPNDIDVFSFLNRPSRYQTDPSLWASTGFPQWTSEVVNRTLNKQRYLIDTYAVAVDQAPTLKLMIETIYWYSLFSHKRATREWKGFVIIPLNAGDDQIALNAIVSGA